MATVLQNISPALIHEAKLGNKDSMNRLAELASERLYAYIYRLTLDQTITQDILQETILFMIQSINQLEHVDHFWGWLFRTAMGKVQHYYRDLQRRKTVELSEEEQLYIHNRVSADFNDGLTELLRKELSDAVFMAMKRLKLKYRNILILRCFENHGLRPNRRGNELLRIAFEGYVFPRQDLAAKAISDAGFRQILLPHRPCPVRHRYDLRQGGIFRHYYRLISGSGVHRVADCGDNEQNRDYRGSRRDGDCFCHAP